MFAVAPLAPLGRLLDVDGRTLKNPESTLATLVMFTSPSCAQCDALRPHLEEMQKRLNRDGAPIVMAALDAVRHSERADELHVRSFPAFAFYPSHGQALPTLFEGSPSLRPLVEWTVKQLAATSAYTPYATYDSDPEAMLHPGASRMDGAAPGRGRMPNNIRRADPPPPLKAASRVECDASASEGFPPLSLVVGGDLALPIIGGGMRVAVARWDVSSPGRWLPLGSASTDASTSRDGALSGVARVLLQNHSSCLYAAGTLRPANPDPDGHDGREENVVRWSAAAGGWQALHGPLSNRLELPARMGGGPRVDEPSDDVDDDADVYAALDGPVSALVAHGGHLFVGGGYVLRRVDGLSGLPLPQTGSVTNRVPRYLSMWEASTASWSRLGTGVDAAVNSLALDATRGYLYASGNFAVAGGAPTPSGVAIWDLAERVWRVPPPVDSGYSNSFTVPSGGSARMVQLVLGGGRAYARAYARGARPVVGTSHREARWTYQWRVEMAS